MDNLKSKDDSITQPSIGTASRRVRNQSCEIILALALTAAAAASLWLAEHRKGPETAEMSSKHGSSATAPAHVDQR